MTEKGTARTLFHPFNSAVPPEGGSILKFNKGPDYRIDTTTGCWIWLRHVDSRGYGKLSPTATLHERFAHREYYRRAHGEIPAGWHVHHRCHNPSCVNPGHLEAASITVHLTAHRQFDSGLSWADVNEIRRIHGEGGTSIEELGERYDISKSEVFNIVANIKWSDPTYTPGRLAQCEECDEAFTATRSNQRFCCAVHRQRWNGRMGERRRNGTPLDAPRRAWSRRAA